VLKSFDFLVFFNNSLNVVGCYMVTFEILFITLAIKCVIIIMKMVTFFKNIGK